MAFRFELATLLRLSEIAEQREERLLGDIQKQIMQSRGALEDLRVQRRRLAVERDCCIRQVTAAIEIQSFDLGLQRLGRLEANSLADLVKLEGQRGEQMLRYKAAYGKRELLAGIRTDRRKSYCEEQTRREQSMMDDNFSSRRRIE